MSVEQPQRDEIERFLNPGYLDLDELLDALEKEVALAENLFRKPTLELRACPPEKRKLAIAISGGGAAGAYSAGLLEVLHDRLKKRGINVGMLVGTSSGAVNGYGVFVQALGMGNPQFKSDPAIKQPYESYIASVWSFLARDSRASRWVVGRRSWIVRLASQGLRSRWHKAGVLVLLVVLAAVLQLTLFLALGLLAAEVAARPSSWIDFGSLGEALPYVFAFALAGTLVLGAAGWFVARAFRSGIFQDLPLLNLLANTGPQGDMRADPRIPRGQTVDRARVLSRDLVSAWYAQRDDAPEFVVASTDITSGRGCLFTLVRPETYARLLRREWMAVQFDSDSGEARDYRSNADALFTLPQNLLQALAASSAVPGAFPTQRIGIYGQDTRRSAHHHFVDGGVLNSSPIHIAIDAGATHVISLEILPFLETGPLQDDKRGDEGYGLIEASLSTFSTVLKRATEEDIRHTASWNRFLAQRPGSMRPGKGTAKRHRRVVPIYRVAPRDHLVGTIEFDGRFDDGEVPTTLRDLVRRGILDMQGRNIWAATTHHEPGWHEPG